MTSSIPPVSHHNWYITIPIVSSRLLPCDETVLSTSRSKITLATLRLGIFYSPLSAHAPTDCFACQHQLPVRSSLLLGLSRLTAARRPISVSRRNVGIHRLLCESNQLELWYRFILHSFASFKAHFLVSPLCSSSVSHSLFPKSVSLDGIVLLTDLLLVAIHYGPGVIDDRRCSHYCIATIPLARKSHGTGSVCALGVYIFWQTFIRPSAFTPQVECSNWFSDSIYIWDRTIDMVCTSVLSQIYITDKFGSAGTIATMLSVRGSYLMKKLNLNVQYDSQWLTVSQHSLVFMGLHFVISKCLSLFTILCGL